jgi:hypothetical protein
MCAVLCVDMWLLVASASTALSLRGTRYAAVATSVNGSLVATTHLISVGVGYIHGENNPVSTSERGQLRCMPQQHHSPCKAQDETPRLLLIPHVVQRQAPSAFTRHTALTQSVPPTCLFLSRGKHSVQPSMR